MIKLRRLIVIELSDPMTCLYISSRNSRGNSRNAHRALPSCRGRFDGGGLAASAIPFRFCRCGFGGGEPAGSGIASCRFCRRVVTMLSLYSGELELHA